MVNRMADILDNIYRNSICHNSMVSRKGCKGICICSLDSRWGRSSKVLARKLGLVEEAELRKHFLSRNLTIQWMKWWHLHRRPFFWWLRGAQYQKRSVHGILRKHRGWRYQSYPHICQHRGRHWVMCSLQMIQALSSIFQDLFEGWSLCQGCQQDLSQRRHWVSRLLELLFWIDFCQ